MPLADHGIARLRDVTTRSISPENLDGGKGGGGRASEGTGAYAARDLGPGWKVSPSVIIGAGATLPMAVIDGPGTITHIWLTTGREVHDRAMEASSMVAKLALIVETAADVWP